MIRGDDMSVQSDFLDAMEIMIREKGSNSTKIYSGKVESVNGKNCNVLVNGQTKQMMWLGNAAPSVNSVYKVYVPQGEFSLAYIETIETLADRVIEYGETDGWSWRKWASGASECSIRQGCYNVTATTAIGALYVSSSYYGGVAYPSGLFTETPKQWLNISGTIQNAFWIECPYGSRSNTVSSTGEWRFLSPTSVATSNDISVDIRAEGRWK
jgi:hypothetical protein